MLIHHTTSFKACDPPDVLASDWALRDCADQWSLWERADRTLRWVYTVRAQHDTRVAEGLASWARGLPVLYYTDQPPDPGAALHFRAVTHPVYEEFRAVGQTYIALAFRVLPRPSAVPCGVWAMETDGTVVLSAEGTASATLLERPSGLDYRGRTVRCARAVPALCERRLFSTAGSHGSRGPEFCTLDAVLN